jgi:hypothetical protein
MFTRGRRYAKVPCAVIYLVKTGSENVSTFYEEKNACKANMQCGGVTTVDDYFSISKTVIRKDKGMMFQGDCAAGSDTPLLLWEA